ncbi:MAG: formylglycine-generating enzyme family protein, partial [Pirellula sp.]
MKFRLIEPGTFMMGSPTSERGRWDSELEHRVTLTKPYDMGIYAVTQSEYQRIMGSNLSRFKGDRHPVEQVSWEDSVEYCRKLTTTQRAEGILPEGWEWRLPTEAE